MIPVLDMDFQRCGNSRSSTYKVRSQHKKKCDESGPLDPKSAVSFSASQQTHSGLTEKWNDNTSSLTLISFLTSSIISSSSSTLGGGLVVPDSDAPEQTDRDDDAPPTEEGDATFLSKNPSSSRGVASGVVVTTLVVVVVTTSSCDL